MTVEEVKMMIKKILSLILIFALTLSLVAIPHVVAAEAENDALFQFQFLKAIGVFEHDAVYTPETLVTREMLAKYLYAILTRRSLDAPTQDEQKEKPFEPSEFLDVDANSSYYEYIKFVCSIGLMSAFKGEFSPSDAVTDEQIAKILVIMLGYNVTVRPSVDYSLDNYYQAAVNIGIFKGYEYSKVKTLTIADTVQLLYHCMNLDVLGVETFSLDGSMQFKTGDIFAETLGIHKIQGIVTANSYTDIYSSGHTTAENIVRIENETYNAGNTDIADRVGIDVTTWYCQEGDGDPEILIYKMSKNVTIIELSAYDLADAQSMDIGGTRLTHVSGEREMKYDISPTAREFYNKVYAGGTYLYDDLKALALNKNGRVRLVDNNGDNKYDVVYIWAYEIYVARSVDNVRGVIYTKESAITSLDFDNGNVKKFEIIKNDATASLTDIATNDIIEYYASKDGQYVTVVATGVVGANIAGKKVDGKLISIEEVDGYAILDIDGLVYTTTVDYWARNGKTIRIGNSYAFYLNSDEKIAYRATNATGEKYGYLLGVGAQGMASLQFKLLTADNTIIIFDGSNSTRLVDGLKSVDGSVVESKLTSMVSVYTNPGLYDPNRGAVRRQTVKYFIDDWGKLSRLYIAREHFAFSCIPVSEYKDDGTLKAGTNTADYTEEDFLIRKVETINPLETPIYIQRSKANGGMVPVGALAPVDLKDEHINLELNYTNFDIGKYIADDKTFAFASFHRDKKNDTIEGVRRNSIYDNLDALSNLPGGNISWNIPAVDNRYAIQPTTVVFSVATALDENDNLIQSYDAQDDLYKAEMGVLPYISYAMRFLHLYDIKTNHSVGAATYLDISTLDYVKKEYSKFGIVTSTPVRVLDKNGEETLKIIIKFNNGTEQTLYCYDSNLVDEGNTLRYYTDDGYNVGQAGIEYGGGGDTRFGKNYVRLRGMYEGMPITDLRPGAVASFTLDNLGRITAFYQHFDGDTTREPYESVFTIGLDSYGNDNVAIYDYNAKGQEQEYTVSNYGPYGNWTSKGITDDGRIRSPNFSSQNLSYDEVLDVCSNGAFSYILVKTRLTSWVYRDRLGTTNGSYDLFYKDESGDTFLEITRVRTISGSPVFEVQTGKRKDAVVLSSLDNIKKGDKIICNRAQNNYEGFVLVYK